MKKSTVPELSAADCTAALRERYKAPEYAFFEQVGDSTGHRQSRWADAVALSLWPSRGFHLHGFEIKVNRQDWKKELTNPAKAEAIQKYCDRWWIVCPSGLIETHELPPTWGLLSVDEKKRLHVTHAGPELAPAPMTVAFIASILRRQQDLVEDIRRQAFQDGRETGARNGAGDLAARLDMMTHNYGELSTTVKAFEEASGLDLRFGWHGGAKIGKAVKMVLDSDHRRSAIDQLNAQAETLDHASALLRKHATALIALDKKDPHQ